MRGPSPTRIPQNQLTFLYYNKSTFKKAMCHLDSHDIIKIGGFQLVIMSL